MVYTSNISYTLISDSANFFIYILIDFKVDNLMLTVEDNPMIEDL